MKKFLTALAYLVPSAVLLASALGLLYCLITITLTVDIWP